MPLAPTQISSIFKRKAGAYQYSPVNEDKQEIRLLTLLRGSLSAELKITLHTDRLTDKCVPEYEALSYAWGSTDDPASLIVKTRLQRRPLGITQNLAQALRHLRKPDRDRVLWIDAICVNQADLVERSNQVKRMANVYRLASRVVVWLGEEKDDSTLAIETLQMLSTKVTYSYADSGLKPTSTDISEQHWADADVDLSFVDEKWISIHYILARPWFERLWIWQEIRLANEHAIVMCGFVEMTWQAFRTATICLGRKPWPAGLLPPEYLGNRFRCVQLAGELPYDFPDLTEVTKSSQCSDPRDRVFALISLIPQGGSVNLEPDYTKTTLEVYRDLFVWQFQQTKKTHLLAICEYNEQYSQMPSWIPELSRPKLADNLNSGRAAAGSEAEVSFRGTGIMTTTGLQLLLIRFSHASFNVQNDLSNWQTVATELQKLVKALKLENLWGGANIQLEMFCRTICADLFSEKFSPADIVIPSFKQGMEIVQWALATHMEDGIIPSLTLDKYLGSFVNRLVGKSLFVTDDGHMGLAPLASREGDYVCILLGCDSHMVLRQNVEGAYQVIGEAYCSDWANGEALLGPLPKNVDGVERFHEGEYHWACIDRDTGKFLDEDPRLGPLPPGWQSKLDNEKPVMYFWNDNEGIEDTWRDPRLTPEALRQKGVPLRTFEIV